MTCPVCGLISPVGAAKCDCGFDFESQTGGVPVLFWKRYRAILIFLSPMNALLLTALLCYL